MRKSLSFLAIAALAAVPFASARAVVRGCGSCTATCQNPLGGTISGSAEACFDFPDMAACRQAATVPCQAYVPLTEECTLSGIPFGVTCTDLGSGRGGGGGNSNADVDLDIPGAEFLPPGNLLSDSRYEHLAGGFNNLGDVSLSGTGYGDAFFTRHYTSSTQDWINAANQRFQDYLDTNRRHKERFGAGAERPEEARQAKMFPSFPPGAGAPGPKTEEFESAYFYSLQGGKTGAGLSAKGPHLTFDDMVRQRMKDKGISQVMDGVPIRLPDAPETEAPGEKQLFGRWGEEAWSRGTNWLGENGFQKQTERVETAKGIVGGLVMDLADIVTEEASNAAAAAGRGSPGEMAAVADRLAERVGKRTGEATDAANEFAIKEFTENLSDALGELASVEIPGAENAKAAWDEAKGAIDNASQFAETVKERVLEIQKRGGDLKAFREVMGEHELSAGSVLNAAAQTYNNAQIPAPEAAPDFKKTPHPDESRFPYRAR